MSVTINDLNVRNLQNGEEVKAVFQRHWFALVGVFGYFIGGFIIIFVLIFFGSRIPLVGSIIDIITVIFISMFILFLYISWMRYELDIYIITNKRIIGLEEVTFLNRHMSECSLDKVQEVNAKTTGLFSNMLNFGVVTIHTASENSDFNMLYMPDAFENARNISNLISVNKEKQEIPSNNGILI